jgi:hypothetical protein
MKKVILFCLLLIASFATNAQPQMTEESMTLTSEIEENQGEIVFIRSTGMPGAAVAIRTFIDEQLASKINNKRFTKHSVVAGKHKYSVQFYGKKRNLNREQVEIEIAAGQKKYVMLFMKMGFWVNKIYAVEISEASAKALYPDFKEDEKY